MYDVTALGELLIDFTPAGISNKNNRLFECNPGGAPANVLVSLSKLGKRVEFIGKVGQDEFGSVLQDTLNDCNVGTEGLVFSKETNTTLAFVHLGENGERSFEFYRKPGADMMLTIDEVDKDIIKKSKIFHFGSLSLTNEPASFATLEAAKIAKENGNTISFDPNLRLALWPDPYHAKEMILKGLEFADILKLSEEEFHFLVGDMNLDEGSKFLSYKYEISLIFITLGKEGCFYRAGNVFGTSEGYPVKPVDTTGAGDAFWGGVLFKLTEQKEHLHNLSERKLSEIASFANGVAALSTTVKGAIPSMPTFTQIKDFLRK